MAGQVTGEIALSEELFGQEVNKSVLHSVVRAYLINQRQGTQSTKTRSEVSGGGKKPWKQKGTGHARQGSTRAPQWTHGGIALGPKPRCYHVDLNKKVKRAALLGAMSSKVAANEMIIVDNITTEGYSTKTMANMLAAIGAGKKSLIVLPEVDAKVVKSCANIPGVKTTVYNSVNTYDVLNCNTFVVSKAAVEKIQEVYAR